MECIAASVLFILVGMLLFNTSKCSNEPFQLTLCLNETFSIDGYLTGRLDTPVPYTVEREECAITFIDLPKPYFWFGGSFHKVVHEVLACDYSLTFDGYTVCAGLIPSGAKASFSGNGDSSVSLRMKSPKDWQHTFYAQLMVARPMCHGNSYTLPIELGTIGRLVSHSKFNFGYIIPTVTGRYSDGERCSVMLQGFVIDEHLLLIKFIYFEVQMTASGYCPDYLSIVGTSSGESRLCGSKSANTQMLFKPSQEVVVLTFVSNQGSIFGSGDHGFMMQYSVIPNSEYENGTVTIVNQERLRLTCNQDYYVNGTMNRNQFLDWTGDTWSPPVHCTDNSTTTTTQSTTSRLTTTTTTISTITPTTIPTTTPTATPTMTPTTSAFTATPAGLASAGITLEYYVYGALVGATVLSIVVAIIVGCCYRKSAPKDDSREKVKRRPFDHVGKYDMSGFS